MPGRLPRERSPFSKPLMRHRSPLVASVYSARMTEERLLVTDPALRPVAERVIAGQSLGYDDGVALYGSRDLHGIGRLATLARERLHGDRTYYNRNRHINY